MHVAIAQADLVACSLSLILERTFAKGWSIYYLGVRPASTPGWLPFLRAGK